MKKIIVGTKSIHKIEAVKQALKIVGVEAEVTGAKTYSGQNEQPVGFEETFLGAMNRANSVWRGNKDATVIGIESGIFRFNRHNKITLDIAVIIILTPDERQIVTTSTGIQFPEEYVDEALKSGFKTTTVGSIIAKKLGGDPTDPHSVLTNGKITRTQTLVDALVRALEQC